MKRLILSFALLISVLAVSCKKENEVSPRNAPAAPVSINVEYVITSVSGQVNAEYIAPNAAGELVVMNETINRPQYSFAFSCMSGNELSVSASNVNPSHSVVQVQIFVNGELKVEDSSTNPSEPAVAHGNF